MRRLDDISELYRFIWIKTAPRRYYRPHYLRKGVPVFNYIFIKYANVYPVTYRDGDNSVLTLLLNGTLCIHTVRYAIIQGVSGGTASTVRIEQKKFIWICDIFFNW